MKFKLAVFTIMIFVLIASTMLEPPARISDITAGRAQAQTQSPGPPPTTWWTLGGNPYRTASVTAGSMGRTGAPSASWTFDPADDDFPFHANPVAADFNGDGVIDLALVNAGGALYIVRADTGALQLSIPPTSLGVGAFSAPTAYDVNGDGRPELIVLTASKRSGLKHVACLSFTTTWGWSVLWRSSVPFTEEYPPTSPLVWRLDPNGPPVVLVSAGNGLYAFNALNGVLLWHHRSYGLTFVSSPALLDDVNGDGVLDVVYTRGYPAIIYAISGRDGALIREWRLWSLDSRLDSLLVVHSPAVGRVTGHACRDIVVSVGRETFEPSGGRWYKTGSVGYLVILNPCSGEYWVVSDPGSSLYAWFSQPAIALADVNRDGRDEIFIIAEDLQLLRFDFSPTTRTFTRTWISSPPASIPPNTGTADAIARAASIAIVEVNGDGILDVLVMYQTGSATSLSYTLRAVNGANGVAIWTATAITETGTGLKYTFPSVSIVTLGGVPRAIVTAFDRVIMYG